ncbi:MAG: hypothetical protein DRP87_08135 [Spirochaetes bacterium]|nr:MAG: hypothetical protein DRP87_08135 [Spirochaetota bacterium]
MERQKILWVVFSVLLFLLIVIGAGLIWFFPTTDKGVAVAGDRGEAEAARVTEREQEFDPIEWVRKADKYPDLTEKEDTEPRLRDFEIVYGEAEKEVKIEPEEPEKKAEEPAEVQPKAQLPARKLPEKEETHPKVVTRAPVEKQPLKPEKIRAKEYWIQTGSYRSKSRAEKVQESLLGKGVVSSITTRVVNGQNYFRVRIGPYEKKEEAEKFLSWIREISGFESSYVSLVYTEKEIR